MVKFRGIEISIVSQFDICKLPEFRYRDPTATDLFAKSTTVTSSASIAKCYVPVYAGSQIWFEYSIDGPHPPNAAYFFKLLFDDKVVNSWDCTAQNGYHGKMMYNLGFEGKDDFTGETLIRRQAIKFDCEPKDDSDQSKSFMEIRIHRIEHRRRIKELESGHGQPNLKNSGDTALRMADCGFIEPGHPQRRYRYQLLDPVDEPFATFRFYYRSLEYLDSIGVTQAPKLSFDRDCSSPMRQCHSRASTQAINVANKSSVDGNQSLFRRRSLISTPTKQSIRVVSPRAATPTSTSPRSTSIPPTDSDDLLSIITKDSITDLPSTVHRSPRSTPARSKSKNAVANITRLSPSRSPRSPRRRLKKKLTLNLNGVEFDLEKKRGPLSPFTSSGVLRMTNPSVPPSAPAAVTAFGPTIYQEIEETVRVKKEDMKTSRAVEKTTRAERSGKTLIRFLGRRSGGGE